MTFTVTEKREHFANRKNGAAWALPIDVLDPTGADDYFAYLKNDGNTDIEIHRINLESTVAGTCEVHGVSGIAAGGQTAVVPVSKIIGDPRQPEVTFETDPDITGLTKLGSVDTIAIDVVSKSIVHEYSEGIIIKRGAAVGLMWDTATGILTGEIHIIEVPEPD